jgi:endogenous inhibitor of DNA gyrase (YacG/DUF329 family)
MRDVEIVEVSPRRCPRCRELVPVRRTGRPAKWCSERCRRAASEEKRAAERGAIAKEVVPQVQVLQPVLRCDQCYSHDTGEKCLHRVTGSPASMAYVLENLTERASMHLFDDAETWGEVLDAFDGLAEQIRRWRVGHKQPTGLAQRLALAPSPAGPRLRREQDRPTVRITERVQHAIVDQLEGKSVEQHSGLHGIEDCVDRVLATPTASARVVHGLIGRLFMGGERFNPRWSKVTKLFAEIAALQARGR